MGGGGVSIRAVFGMIIKAPSFIIQLTESSQEVPQEGGQRNTLSDLREVQSPFSHSIHDTVFVPDGEQRPRESDLGESQTPSYSLESELEKAVHSCIDYCLEKSIENPVEILRCAQRFLLCGRPLDVTDPSVTLEGETNFILVNRQNVFQSAKEEFQSISEVTNPRVTLEVSFYGEGAVDAGGPRREFFRLCLQEIKRDYFDSGLKEHLSDDYVFVGTVMALSALQNGNIPRFLSEDQLQELFGSGEPSECLGKLRIGFEKVRIYQIGNALPTFLHLFRPSPASMLSRPKLLDLLKPQFSAEGSNARMDENSTYQALLRYVQEAASGRRESVTHSHILQFVTGADEEPPLGFTSSPSIESPRSEGSSAWSFLPMAHTCSNTLHLPRCVSANNCQLPDDKELFRMYDYAFCSAFLTKSNKLPP